MKPEFVNTKKRLSLPTRFIEILSFQKTSHPAEPLREASQAAPLCAWAHGSQCYKRARHLPQSGHKILSKKSAL